ncbi:hypothetical protein GUITHDRAFT_105821 [Guillardia theta CCMP2712]|uniref:Uncharacterized protein n=1 Tax=Guillardia theta (strain CCMP2712) TaxID=905079 RepID=L1JJ85_GUITC|nr:hypothetical protein GUITHDRAFT_105821 [Guillardia theta CCMP2712]EKX48214.1 hypothetical protein GUITHDRAFT_105821 [Guillardia theta CCMP2712]|eukprot:XP_005835194.1 hypothetical protein GUITHDRAFT_105821 [Guillardia theta CCMP2712]
MKMTTTMKMKMEMKMMLLLATVTMAAASTCYTYTQKATIGGCPEQTYQYGSCTSLADATSQLSARISNWSSSPPANDAACQTQINMQCAGFGMSATGSKCSDLCPFQFHTVLGCTEDLQCNSTSTPDLPICCKYLGKQASVMCNGLMAARL